MPENRWAQKALSTTATGKKRKGNKKTWQKQMVKDFEKWNLTKEDALNKTQFAAKLNENFKKNIQNE